MIEARAILNATLNDESENGERLRVGEDYLSHRYGYPIFSTAGIGSRTEICSSGISFFYAQILKKCRQGNFAHCEKLSRMLPLFDVK